MGRRAQWRCYLLVENLDGSPDIFYGDEGYDIIQILAGGGPHESAYGPFTLSDGLFYIAWDENGSYLGEQSYIVNDVNGTQLGAGDYGSGDQIVLKLVTEISIVLQVWLLI